MLRVSDNGFGTTRQSYPGVWFQGWRALLLGRLPRVIILQTLTSLGNRPAPARNVRHPDLSSASTPPRNRPARSFPVFCDLLESLNDTKVIPKASVRQPIAIHEGVDLRQVDGILSPILSNRSSDDCHWTRIPPLLHKHLLDFLAWYPGCGPPVDKPSHVSTFLLIRPASTNRTALFAEISHKSHGDVCSISGDATSIADVWSVS